MMMNRFQSRLIFLGAAVIFFFSFAAVYNLYRQGNEKPWTAAGEVAAAPTVQQDTVIVEEIRYQCGDKVTSRVPTTSDLVGLNFSELVQKYPPEAGWSIDDSKSNLLVLARMENGVCRYHQDFRHFGMDAGYLAIFEGPLGYNAKVLERENITVDALPAMMKQDLAVVMNYDDLDPDTQARMKASYEFESDVELNTVLENFDEYQGQ